MTTSLITPLEQERFHHFLQNCFADVNINDSLQKVRKKSWEQYEALGLPSSKTEPFRYIKTRHLLSPDYIQAKPLLIAVDEIAPHIYPECAQSHLVFVNGHYQPLLSNTSALPKQVAVTTLNEAMRTFSTFLMHYWTQSIKEERDPFAAINAALHQNGAFVYLPPRTVLESPLQIIHIISPTESPSLLLPRVHVFAGVQSQASIVLTTHHLSGLSYGIDQVTDLSLEEGAQLHVTQASFGELDNNWHLDALRATLKRDSSLKCVHVTQGGLLSRQDYRIALGGENSEALLHGVSLLDGKREAHTQILMNHQAPNCRSNQHFKNVLSGITRSSFEGKILVQKPAQKTAAYQLNNTLLLSDLAQAASKPNLEIFADDVKASHGATIGQLNAEHELYMRTRGLSASQAKNLLVYGFCKEIIDLVTLPSLHAQLTAMAKKYVKESR